MAQNVTTTVSGTTLIIKVDLSAPKVASASGKSDILASSKGNIDVPGVPGLKLGLNVYFPK
jgi:hypothetical protein